MSYPYFSRMFLLDIFHLNTVLNVGHELHAVIIGSHGLAMGHIFWRGMWYIGYYKQSTFQTWRVVSRQPVISAENEFNFVPFCKIHSSFLETYP